MYIIKRAFVLLTLLLTAASSIKAQVQGCKDPAATNYNPAATVSNGSCTYNITVYTPSTKVSALSDLIAETSGLQWANGHLWTFADGGGAAAIYKIDTLTRAIWQTVHLEGATNIDWEDIAFDGTHFYIGDIGNNNGGRSDLKIYKFPLAAIPDHTSQPIVTIPTAQIQVIHFSYTDQPKPIVPTTANETSFDCEAMLVDNGAIHLFSKDWINKTTTHYRINSIMPGTFSAQPIETLPVNYLVTAADKVAGKPVIMLMGYDNVGLATHYLHMLSDYSGGNFFNGNKRKIDLPNALVMGQGEGITFKNETYGYISNERFSRSVGGFALTVEPKLFSFDVSQFIPEYVLPISLKIFTVIEKQGKNQIEWHFEEVVPYLSIEHSIDGSRFSSITSFTNSKDGSTTHTPKEKTNFYRIKWSDDASHSNYSKVIKVKTNSSSNISHMVMNASGELHFTVNGNMPEKYGFRINGQDGSLLAHEGIKKYTQGRHRLFLKTVQRPGSVLFVTIDQQSGKETRRILVQ